MSQLGRPMGRGTWWCIASQVDPANGRDRPEANGASERRASVSCSTRFASVIEMPETVSCGTRGCLRHDRDFLKEVRSAIHLGHVPQYITAVYVNRTGGYRVEEEVGGHGFV